MNPEKFAGLFLQVSKISFAGFFIFVLLFQQLDVGSEAYGSPTPDKFRMREDTVPKPDSTVKVLNDSTRADTLAADTNISDEGDLKSLVKYDARDSMRADIVNEITYLYGAATVDYEDMHLKADYIVIDMNKKELFAEGVTDSLGVLQGKPEFSQADQKFKSTSIRYNFNSRKGKIAYVVTKEGEGYIHGEVVKKDPENNFYIKKGQYTTCDRDQPDFAITSNRLKVIKNNKIVTGPAYLTIEGVPTPILLPFGFFPNKKGRSSGIIFPSFGESASRGFYFENLGYYFGFSDYATLAVTTDVYTKGSYTLNGVSNYKNRYHYGGNFSLNYAYTVNGDKEIPGYNTTKDFRINWTHSQDPKLNPNSTFSANVNAGTSTYYSNTISSVNNFLTNTFQSSISYSHSFPDKPINLTLALNHSQNIITHDIRITAPDLSFNVSRIYPFKRKNPVGKERWFEKIGTSYTMRGTNYIDTKDSLLFTNESLDKFKNGIQHILPFSTSFNVFNYFNFSPSFNYTEKWYMKTTQYSWNTESQTVDTFVVNKFQAGREYSASLGVSTRIYGMYQFHHGPIVALRHVLSPSATFSYRPDFGKEQYGYYKNVQVDTTGRMVNYSIFQNTVYGGPSSGPYANLGFSLDNNLEMKVKTNSDTGVSVKKVKLLESLRLGTNYNMIADSMKLGQINVTGRTSVVDKVTLNFGGILDPYSFDENNIDYDRFMITDGGKLVRLTSANASMNFSLHKSADKDKPAYSKSDLEYLNQHPEAYIDFEIPYNLAVSYSLTYGKRGSDPSILSQSASFNGDMNLTPQWKIGFNSWYDITNGKFTNFGVNFYRDLHCWEMHMSWIPFGYQESWNFQINVKASILQDLKLKKQNEFYDKN